MKKLVLCCCLLLLSAPARAASQWDPIIQRLAAQGLDRAWVGQIFARPDMRHDPDPMRNKLHTLFRILRGGVNVKKIQEGLNLLGCGVPKADGVYGPGTRAAIEAFQLARGLPVDGLPTQEVIDAIEKELVATGKKPPPQACWTHGKTHSGVLTPLRLAEAREFHVAAFGALQSMEAAFGVPGEMATAILTVETRHGRILGQDRAVRILASMALDGDETRAAAYFASAKLTDVEKAWLKATAAKRGDWAFNELAALLRYCKANGKDPFAFPSSVYGAVGWPQFMPSNIEKFGADGDGDNVIDLFDPDDAVHSVGKYFKGWGWGGTMDLAKKQQVVWHYNHSEVYVNTVLAVADRVREDLKPLPVPKLPRSVPVKTVAELRAGLASGVRLELAPGRYDLAGQPLLLKGLRDVALVGTGQVLIVGAIHIADSQKIFLHNLALRPASGAALAMANAGEITAQHLRLNGGVQVDRTAALRLKSTLLEDLKTPALAATQSSGLILEDCVLRRVAAPSLLSLRGVRGMTIKDGVLRDLSGAAGPMTMLVDADPASAELSLSGALLEDNAVAALASAPVATAGLLIKDSAIPGVK